MRFKWHISCLDKRSFNWSHKLSRVRRLRSGVNLSVSWEVIGREAKSGEGSSRREELSGHAGWILRWFLKCWFFELLRHKWGSLLRSVFWWCSWAWLFLRSTAQCALFECPLNIGLKIWLSWIEDLRRDEGLCQISQRSSPKSETPVISWYVWQKKAFRIWIKYF